jgi:hypothetical protein
LGAFNDPPRYVEFPDNQRFLIERLLVAYGFRSTFRTWGQEQVKSSEEALELSLKHLEASATRAAYARSQLFYERRRILNAYELWCFKGDAGQSNKVIDLPKRRKLANA